MLVKLLKSDLDFLGTKLEHYKFDKSDPRFRDGLPGWMLNHYDYHLAYLWDVNARTNVVTRYYLTFEPAFQVGSKYTVVKAVREEVDDYETRILLRMIDRHLNWPIKSLTNEKIKGIVG